MHVKHPMNGLNLRHTLHSVPGRCGEPVEHCESNVNWPTRARRNRARQRMCCKLELEGVHCIQTPVIGLSIRSEDSRQAMVPEKDHRCTCVAGLSAR